LCSCYFGDVGERAFGKWEQGRLGIFDSRYTAAVAVFVAKGLNKC